MRIHQQHKVGTHYLADRGEVFHGVVGQLVVAAGRDAELAGFTQHQRVAVRRGTGGLSRGNQAASTRLVIHNHAHIAPCLRQLLRQNSGHDVGARACGKAHNQTHRAAGVGSLRLHCTTPNTRYKACANSKAAAHKRTRGVSRFFHGVLLLRRGFIKLIHFKKLHGDTVGVTYTGANEQTFAYPGQRRACRLEAG